METFFPNLARDIKSKQLPVDVILKQIEGKMLKDEDVAVALKSKVFKRNEMKNVRYLLQKIYAYENNGEILINDNSMHVNLEHILPQNPKKNSSWENLFVKETREEYIGNLGNMTLVLSTANSSIGNKEFEEKREILAESQIPQNKEIAKLDQWTP